MWFWYLVCDFLDVDELLSLAKTNNKHKKIISTLQCLNGLDVNEQNIASVVKNIPNVQFIKTQNFAAVKDHLKTLHYKYLDLGFNL